MLVIGTCRVEPRGVSLSPSDLVGWQPLQGRTTGNIIRVLSLILLIAFFSNELRGWDNRGASHSGLIVPLSSPSTCLRKNLTLPSGCDLGVAIGPEPFTV